MLKPYQLIMYSGIIAYTLLAAVFITGIRRMGIELHEHLAVAAVIFASIHAGILLYKRLKAK